MRVGSRATLQLAMRSMAAWHSAGRCGGFTCVGAGTAGFSGGGAPPKNALLSQPAMPEQATARTKERIDMRGRLSSRTPALEASEAPRTRSGEGLDEVREIPVPL